MHLNVTLDGQSVDDTNCTAMVVKIESQSYVIDSGGLHNEMIVCSGMFENLLKPADIVTDLQVEEFTQVVLVTNIKA
jgi:hypothetical protein